MEFTCPTLKSEIDVYSEELVNPHCYLKELEFKSKVTVAFLRISVKAQSQNVNAKTAFF